MSSLYTQSLRLEIWKTILNYSSLLQNSHPVGFPNPLHFDLLNRFLIRIFLLISTALSWALITWQFSYWLNCIWLPHLFQSIPCSAASMIILTLKFSNSTFYKIASCSVSKIKHKFLSLDQKALSDPSLTYHPRFNFNLFLEWEPQVNIIVPPKQPTIFIIVGLQTFFPLFSASKIPGSVSLHSS